MTQPQPLPDLDADARFRVVGAKPVAFMLAGFAKERDSFSVTFDGGEMAFLTTLLAVDAGKGRLIFDCSGSEDANRRLLASDRNVFSGRPNGVPVHFATGPASAVSFEGGKAFAVALPAYVVRLQRREYFRIEIPKMSPLVFFGRLPDGSLLKLTAHDISVSGIGVDAPVLPEGLELGLLLPNCHCSLPGDNRDFFFGAVVRNMREIESRAGARHWRIGLEFNGLPSSDQMRIQRYIARIERDRHELT